MRKHPTALDTLGGYMSSDTNIYYVYAYLRSKDSKTAKAGTPYYIGKGCKYRAWAKHKTVPLPPDRSNIIILETNLTLVGSLAIERRLIRWYGRKDLGSGVLINLTDGGEGAVGITKGLKRIRKPTGPTGRPGANLGKTFSEDTKRKMSDSSKGKSKSAEHIAKMKISARARAPVSEETRKKLSEATKRWWLARP